MLDDGPDVFPKIEDAPDALTPMENSSVSSACPEWYLQEHFQAIHRIYSLLMPDKRIRYVLKMRDEPVGAPDGVRIDWKSNDNAHYMGEGFLGCVEIGGAPGDPVDSTILVGVPKFVSKADIKPTKTAPSFRNPAVRTVLKMSPILFEQLKYIYERYQLQRRARRHGHVSLRRNAMPPFGFPVDRRQTAQRPAILIGVHWLEVGGAEKLGLASVKWALSAGFRVFLVADVPEVQRLAGALPDDTNLEFIRTDAYLPYHLWSEFLEALVRTENIRVVHIHHCQRLYGALPRLKAIFPDLTVIDSTHIVEYSDGGFARISGVWTNFIDYHHVISRQLSGFLLDNFSISEKVKLGRMLDPADTCAETPEPTFSLQAGTQTLRLAFVGRMVHQKRAPLAIAIAARLAGWARGRAIDLHFDVVGTGPYLAVVRNMIAKAALDDVVTLHDADADVPELLRKADILLVPSANEGLALVCYEAIQNGAIPISTNVGGQDELMPDELLVPLAPVTCIRKTVETVKRLATDADFLERCTTGLVATYRDLRRDATAEDVLSALYIENMEALS